MPIEIILLGPPDEAFAQAYTRVQQAIAHAQQHVSLLTRDDPALARQHNIEELPALIVDGEVKSAGTIPEPHEIVTWIMNAALKKQPD